MVSTRQPMAHVPASFADGRQRQTEQATDEEEPDEQIDRPMMVVGSFKKLPRSADDRRHVDRGIPRWGAV